MPRTRTVIMGAAGRDFHNFNVLFRNDRRTEVVAFTATQIPNIHGRKYPRALAGALYPKGIPIVVESDLVSLIRDQGVTEVVFAYSDVSNQHVMSKAAVVNANGAHFRLLGAGPTMLPSKKPIVSVCAVRTGSGKSQTTRKVAGMLRDAGRKVAVVRHPMPYGDLAKQKVQRFGSIADLAKHHCTIEEIEEYEPHIVAGTTVFAGVDYEAILRKAELEADVVLWDGGNNDMPFFRPDLHIVVADPLRVGNERTYYPAEANLRMAHVVIINKIDTASAVAVDQLRDSVRAVNPHAVIIDAASPITVDHPDRITGKRALVVEDGPTLTHGDMKFGAGMVAARKWGASEIVDPRPYVVRSIGDTFRKYPDIGILLPAMGYGDEQVKDLEATINKVPCDVVVIGTPIDLTRLVKIKKPTVRVRYDLQELGRPDLHDVLGRMLA